MKPKIIDSTESKELKVSKRHQLDQETKKEIEEIEEEENKEHYNDKKRTEMDETYKRLEGLDLNVICTNSIKGNKNKITKEASPIERNNDLLDSLDLDTGVLQKMKQKYSK